MFMMQNNPRTPIVLLLFTLLAAGHAEAQDGRTSFASYSRFVSKVFGISWNKPKGFTDLHTDKYWKPNNSKTSTLHYNFLFRSEEGDCIVMYPDISTLYFPLQAPKTLDTKHLIAGDLGLSGQSEEVEHGMEKRQVVTLKCENSKKCIFNADTVYICNLPLAIPYDGKYAHCTGIYVCKKNRPALYFKCFFTNEGEKKKSEYIRRLSKAVGYRKKDWTYNNEQSGKEYYRLYIERHR